MYICQIYIHVHIPSGASGCEAGREKNLDNLTRKLDGDKQVNVSPTSSSANTKLVGR